MQPAVMPSFPIPSQLYPSLDGHNDGIQWPTTGENGDGTSTLYMDSFYDGKASLLPININDGRLVATEEHPFLLIPGRVLHQPQRDMDVVEEGRKNYIRRDETVIGGGTNAGGVLIGPTPNHGRLTAKKDWQCLLYGLHPTSSGNAANSSASHRFYLHPGTGEHPAVNIPRISVYQNQMYLEGWGAGPRYNSPLSQPLLDSITPQVGGKSTRVPGRRTSFSMNRTLDMWCADRYDFTHNIKTRRAVACDGSSSGNYGSRPDRLAQTIQDPSTVTSTGMHNPQQLPLDCKFQIIPSECWNTFPYIAFATGMQDDMYISYIKAVNKLIDGLVPVGDYG